MGANDRRIFVVNFPTMDSRIQVAFSYGDTLRSVDSTVTGVGFSIEEPVPPPMHAFMHALNRAAGILDSYDFTKIESNIRKVLYDMNIANTNPHTLVQFSGCAPTVAFPRERAHILSIKESLLRIVEERAAEIEAEENALVHHTAVGVVAVAAQLLINLFAKADI
jgi:hypothetical protein